MPSPPMSGGYARVKDIAMLQNVRDNQLIGYGLVIGLQGSGDSLRNSPFTEQSVRSMLDRLGVNIRGSQLRARNVAAVIVTANLPPFAGKGSRIDVTVSSLGDATSLAGGTLVFTPLTGADGRIYAVAQGPLAVSGFSSSGDAENLTQGVPTTGRIANGALVERQTRGQFSDISDLVLELRNPDFGTAVNVTDAINAYAIQRYGRAVAEERDLRTIKLEKPDQIGAARFIAEIGELPVMPATTARVVIDERSGTIVIGQDVTISTVAVTHGSLTVRVTEEPTVVQPEPFARGVTAVEPRTTISADEQHGQLRIVDGADLNTLVEGLNQMGLKPMGIIAILQAIKSAGALQAELVVQ
ncbi:flagellar basal body P-ring protein FlgI [Nordella sp. HKS 07]|uniref:flagellar basal body P-ring protein FlgI n=1 Tax=Nordella sp. HKS 07 TaxID=2712222 RepID=UPI001FF06C5B|nr:flagellar basal body P-ring protein FlgI [Nordella sp. HKS 07]